MSVPVASAALSRPTMQLKIVSNVEEVGTHMFSQIPTDTTIGWIKNHLRDTLPAHPAPERQRYIHQGRFLEDDAMTLASIFGDSPTEQHAIHLVLRPLRPHGLAAHQEGRTASAPPDPSRARSSSPSNSASAPLQTNGPQQDVRIQHTFAQQGTASPVRIQQQMQQMMQYANQMAGNMMQLQMQMSGVQMPPVPTQFQQLGPSQQPNQPNQPTQASNMPRPQSSNAMQQLAPTAVSTPAGPVPVRPSTGPPRLTGNVVNTSNAARDHLLAHPAHVPPQLPLQALQQGPQAPPPLPEQMLRDRSQRISQLLAQHGAPYAQRPRSVDPQSLRNSAQDLNAGRDHVTSDGRPRVQQDRANWHSAVQSLPSMQRLPSLVSETTRLHHDAQRLRILFDSLSTDVAYSTNTDFARLRVVLQDLELQADVIEASLLRLQATAVPGTRPGAATANADVTAQSRSALPSTDRSISLLRSPSGEPHALLVGPSGTYRTPELNSNLLAALFDRNGNDTFARALPHVLGNPSAASRAPPGRPSRGLGAIRQQGAPHLNMLQGGNRRARSPQPLGPNGPQAAAGNVQGAPRNAMGAGDFRRMLRPIAGPLWLAVRIAFMVYIFGGVGGGANSWLHWRPVLIAVLMLLGWASQQPFMLRRWAAIQRHFEQLLGVHLGQLAPGIAGPARHEHQQAAAPGAEPRLEQGADNLARQQDEGQRTWLEHQLRGVERAVAVFVASLWPGMGEGIVRARREAEDRRQREEQQAEAARAAQEGRGRVAGLDDGRAEAAANASAPPPSAGPAAASTGRQAESEGAEGGGLRRVNRGGETAPAAPGSLRAAAERGHLG